MKCGTLTFTQHQLHLPQNRALIARLILFTLNSALFSKSVAGTFTERCIAKRLKLSTDNYNAITFKTEKTNENQTVKNLLFYLLNFVTCKKSKFIR